MEYDKESQVDDSTVSEKECHKVRCTSMTVLLLLMKLNMK